MFSYTITQLKADLSASLHGTTLNKVQSVNGLIQRAGADLLLELDPMETKRIVELASPIYSNVYDYYLPEDLKGTKIIDIRPQANRTLMDRYVQEYNQAFSLGKRYATNPNFTIQHNTGFKTIRIDNNLLLQGIQLSPASSPVDTGTWVGTDGASNLSQDFLQFTDGQASSLEFDIDASGTATLTDVIQTPLDCSGQDNQSQIFFFTYLPTASAFSTVEIRWGNDSSNYWTQTLNSTNVGTVFSNGWNLLEADWETATIGAGAPDNSSISWIQIIWTYTGSAQTGLRVNSIYSRLGVISDIEYYSKYLYTNAQTGAFQETITDDSNIVNLDTESRNLLYLLTGTYIVQQVQGLDAMFFDSNFFQQKYASALASYKSQYKSEWQKPRSTYYKMPNPSNQNWFGGRFNY